MNQCEKLLRALREAGPVGWHSLDCRSKLFIGNPSQRVIELEEQGHLISVTRERLPGRAVGVRYRLEREAPKPKVVAVLAPAVEPEQLTLDAAA